jgi:hypothetical protein
MSALVSWTPAREEGHSEMAPSETGTGNGFGAFACEIEHRRSQSRQRDDGRRDPLHPLAVPSRD